MIRRPASLHAVPRCGEVPTLHGGGFASPFGTIRALRLPAARPATLRFPSLGGTVDAFAVSLPPACERARPAGRGLLRFGQPVPRWSSTETTGSPKFLGNPHCTFAGLFDPGRAMASDHSRRHDAAPVAGTSGAPALRLSRLNPPALVLAVYASPRRLPAKDARLASGCWSGSAGRALTRRVPTRGFRVCPYISSSSPKLAWRNPAFRASVGAGAEVVPAPCAFAIKAATIQLPFAAA